MYLFSTHIKPKLIFISVFLGYILTQFVNVLLAVTRGVGALKIDIDKVVVVIEKKLETIKREKDSLKIPFFCRK